MKLKKFYNHLLTILFVWFSAVIAFCFLFSIIGFMSELAYRDKVRGYDDKGWQYNYLIAQHGEDISILVEFSFPSDQHRFFVVDNKTGEIISASKCAHGAGGGSTADKPVFSNTPGSQCSSLGTYRLLYNDNMQNNGFPCIRIKGLDATNSNAQSRGIVIHEAPIVADDVTLGVPIPVSPLISQGCFAISSETFELLQNLVKEKKTIYLYAVPGEPVPGELSSE